ncbi:MAG: hypothetical protein ACRERU_18870 [Methylococcales bacterium]
MLSNNRSDPLLDSPFNDPSSGPAIGAKAGLLGAFVLAACTGVGYKVWSAQKSVGADDCTAVPPREIAALIDPSDLPSPEQLLALKGSIRRQQSNLPTGAKLSLYLLTPEGSELVRPLFSACKPKSGAQAERLTENRKLLDQAYYQRWTEPLETTLSELDAMAPASSSPILEGLHALGQQAGWGKGSLELEIWSDLLQKSKTLDQYAAPCRSYQDLLQGQSLYAQAAGLTGAEIRVYRWTNDKTKKTEPACHTAFWNDYFTQSSGLAPTWLNL